MPVPVNYCGQSVLAPFNLGELDQPLDSEFATSDHVRAEQVPAVVRKSRCQVAGMTPTDQQADILDTAEWVQSIKDQRRVVVIGAGAGTGKTATLKMLEQVLSGQGQYTAFNKSLVEESKTKFKKAAVNSTHSLAFRAVGKNYSHRLNQPRMKGYKVAETLGIEGTMVTWSEKGESKNRFLDGGFLAGQVMIAVSKFCQSADREITLDHFRYVGGIDTTYIDEEGTYHKSSTNNDRVKAYLLPFAKRAWEDLTKLDGVLNFSHDHYVKVWQLGRPYIAADYILIDESQDSAAVFLDILKQQTHAMLIMVGDENQQIYSWRGSVDAMKAFEGAPRKLLSQSFRFGQSIADVANSILRTLDEPTDLVMQGLPSINSKVCKVTDPKCVLCRTNAKAISTILHGIEDGKRPHLIGKVDDLLDFFKAALELKANWPTKHQELCCFNNWKEVVEYSKTDEGEDLALNVKLVEEFGAQEIIDALKNMPEEKDADFVVSTAHKSKGRQWESVKLADDFPTANKLGDEGRRLLYVAATRAQFQLDIGECPPFVVRRDPYTGEAIDVIEVEFTAEQDEETVDTTPIINGQVKTYQPSTNGELLDQLEKSFADRDEGAFKDVVEEIRLRMTAGSRITTVEQVMTAQRVVKVQAEKPAEVKFSWAKVDDEWTACGAPDMEGEEVEVVRKNGSSQWVTLGQVVTKYGDKWCYEVEK